MMRNLILAFLLCVGGNVFAQEPSMLCFRIPEGMHQTWNINNTGLGIDFDLYQREGDEKNFLLVGKASLSECDKEEAFSQIQEQFEMISDFSDEEIQLETLSPLYHEEGVEVTRMRLTCSDEEEIMALLDMHMIIKDEHMYILYCMTLDDETEEFELMTTNLLRSVKFE